MTASTVRRKFSVHPPTGFHDRSIPPDPKKNLKSPQNGTRLQVHSSSWGGADVQVSILALGGPFVRGAFPGDESVRHHRGVEPGGGQGGGGSGDEPGQGPGAPA